MKNAVLGVAFSLISVACLIPKDNHGEAKDAGTIALLIALDEEERRKKANYDINPAGNWMSFCKEFLSTELVSAKNTLMTFDVNKSTFHMEEIFMDVHCGSGLHNVVILRKFTSGKLSLGKLIYANKSANTRARQFQVDVTEQFYVAEKETGLQYLKRNAPSYTISYLSNKAVVGQAFVIPQEHIPHSKFYGLLLGKQESHQNYMSIFMDHQARNVDYMKERPTSFGRTSWVAKWTTKPPQHPDATNYLSNLFIAGELASVGVSEARRIASSNEAEVTLMFNAFQDFEFKWASPNKPTFAVGSLNPYKFAENSVFFKAPKELRVDRPDFYQGNKIFEIGGKGGKWAKYEKLRMKFRVKLGIQGSASFKLKMRMGNTRDRDWKTFRDKDGNEIVIVVVP